MSQTANIVQLKPRTLQAFEEYIRDAEAAMEPSLRGERPFLWSDTNSDVAQQISKGAIVAEFWSGEGAIELPNGLIHDWIGAVFVPGGTVEQALALVQNYDNHKDIYKPDV